MNTATAFRQLTLGVGLDDDATFDNFHVTELNRGLLSALRDRRSQQPVTLIWGAGATGRTHLLQAACHQAGESGQESLYIPLLHIGQLEPAILQDVHTLGLVCIDDVQLLAGIEDWERALFNAMNACVESGTRLLLAADLPPQRLPVALADLHSRLQQPLILQIASPDDAGKRAAFLLRAAARGLTIPVEVGDYIIQRAERNLTALMQILDKLDSSSLERKRRITIPLVKSTMGW